MQTVTRVTLRLNMPLQVWFSFLELVNTELFMVNALFLFYSIHDKCIVLLNVNVKFAL